MSGRDVRGTGPTPGERRGDWIYDPDAITNPTLGPDGRPDLSGPSITELVAVDRATEAEEV